MSFLRLFESITESNPNSLKAIRAGQNIDEDFWQNFIQVCNNTENMAELLGVSPVKVASWGHKIKLALKEAEKIKTDKTKTKVIPTGEV